MNLVAPSSAPSEGRPFDTSTRVVTSVTSSPSLTASVAGYAPLSTKRCEMLCPSTLVPSPIVQAYVSASPFSSVAEPLSSTVSPSTDAYGPPTSTTGGTFTGSGAQLFASRYPSPLGV